MRLAKMLIEKQRLRFDPSVSPEAVAQASVDLRLGHSFARFKKDVPKYLSAIKMDPSIWESRDLWDRETADEYRLSPKGFVVAQSLEFIHIPADLVGFVEGRSSWARLGVSVHVTAPKIDPGFKGTITFEMMNFGEVAIDLRAEIDQPAQLMLFRLSGELSPEELYGQLPGDIFYKQDKPIPTK
jgi:dCTP deaminase